MKMMKWNVLLLLIGLSAVAAEFMSPDDVSKEFKEPGHIPQGLPPSKYQKLDKVIPKESQQKIKMRKQKLDVESIPEVSPSPEASQEPSEDVSFFNFFPRAHASGKKKPEPKPVVVVTPTPKPAPVTGVDLRKYDSYVRNQWNGTCTAHGLIAGMENILNRSRQRTLSTRYFWSQYQRYSAEVAMKAAGLYKQVDESYWPQNSTRPLVSNISAQDGVRLASSEYLYDNTQAVISALNKQYPVYVAMSVPQDMSACRSTIRYTTGVTTGGHALLVSGYRLDSSVQGGGYWILKNSWGTQCADQGYQYMPFALCQKQGMYCMFWSIHGVKNI